MVYNSAFDGFEVGLPQFHIGIWRFRIQHLTVSHGPFDSFTLVIPRFHIRRLTVSQMAFDISVYKGRNHGSMVMAHLGSAGLDELA